jgi:hypothetical protein
MIADRLDACWPGVWCLAAGDGAAVAMRISGALAGLGAATAGAVASVALLPPIIKTGAGWIGSCEQAARKSPIATIAPAPGQVDLTFPIAPLFGCARSRPEILRPTSTEPERRLSVQAWRGRDTRQVADNDSWSAESASRHASLK